MLVHFFCLLEFKFKFEFICLNPFLKYLNPIPNPYPFPAHRPAQAHPRSQPRSPHKPSSSPAAVQATAPA
jgi:hypothetical protein